MSMEDYVLRIERSIAARRTSHAEDGVSARRSHGSLLHELDQRVRGQRRSTIERCAEFDPCDFVINGQSGNAKGNPGKSKCVLDGIVQSPLFATGSAALPKNAGRIAEPEHGLTRRVRPPLAPASGSEAVDLAVSAISDIVVSPRQRGRPVPPQCHGPIPIEVKLLVEFYEKLSVEGEVPAAWSKLRGLVASSERRVNHHDFCH